MPTESTNVAAHGPQLLRWDTPLAIGDFRVSAYLGNSQTGTATQDALVALAEPERVVLAVADGVTPTPRTPTIDDLDGARFAALRLLQHVRKAPSYVGLEDVFRETNANLFARFAQPLPTGMCARDLPQTAGAAVEILMQADGLVKSVAGVRAADCDIWWRVGPQWHQSDQKPMLVDEVRHWLALWDMTNPTGSSHERVLEETRWLNDSAYWNTTALGRFDEAKIEHIDVPADVDEIALATDGVQFGHFVERDGRDLAGWMRQLRSWEHIRTCEAPRHNDVALLSLQFADSGRSQSASTRYLNT